MPKSRIMTIIFLLLAFQSVLPPVSDASHLPTSSSLTSSYHRIAFSSAATSEYGTGHRHLLQIRFAGEYSETNHKSLADPASDQTIYITSYTAWIFFGLSIVTLAVLSYCCKSAICHTVRTVPTLLLTQRDCTLRVVTEFWIRDELVSSTCSVVASRSFTRPNQVPITLNVFRESDGITDACILDAGDNV